MNTYMYTKAKVTSYRVFGRLYLFFIYAHLLKKFFIGKHISKLKKSLKHFGKNLYTKNRDKKVVIGIYK